jgi:hypothetical protein
MMLTIGFNDCLVQPLSCLSSTCTIQSCINPEFQARICLSSTGTIQSCMNPEFQAQICLSSTGTIQSCMNPEFQAPICLSSTGTILSCTNPEFQARSCGLLECDSLEEVERNVLGRLESVAAAALRNQEQAATGVAEPWWPADVQQWSFGMGPGNATDNGDDFEPQVLRFTRLCRSIWIYLLGRLVVEHVCAQHSTLCFEIVFPDLSRTYVQTDLV